MDGTILLAGTLGSVIAAGAQSTMRSLRPRWKTPVSRHSASMAPGHGLTIRGTVRRQYRPSCRRSNYGRQLSLPSASASASSLPLAGTYLSSLPSSSTERYGNRAIISLHPWPPPTCSLVRTSFSVARNYWATVYQFIYRRKDNFQKIFRTSEMKFLIRDLKMLKNWFDW